MNNNAIIALVELIKELILSRCRTKEDAQRLMEMLMEFERCAMESVEGVNEVHVRNL